MSPPPSPHEQDPVDDRALDDDEHAATERSPDAQLAELRDKWLRARADLENVRKRAAKDVEDARLFGAAALLRDLLPVLDNLQRALAAPPEGLDEAFLAGLRLIERQWTDALAAAGVRAIAAEGAPFDPNLHQALQHVETTDAPAGTVMHEIVRGYTLHERLLREAQVVVAKAPGPDGSAG